MDFGGGDQLGVHGAVVDGRTQNADAAAVKPALVLALAVAALGAGRRWAHYEHEMQHPAEDPSDAAVPGEFVFGRLRYRSPYDRGGFRHHRWGTDANRSERHFLVALRRLTRVNAKSIEQVVDIDSDEIYQYPFLYAVAAGHWALDDAQARRLGSFLARGGSLVVDDLHNETEWAGFMDGLRQAMPGRQWEEIPDDDPIMRAVYKVDRSVQVSGYNIVWGSPYERGGYVPGWRAIRDDMGRIVVSAWFNQDLGDAWEWADDPRYPEKLSSLAFRFGVNWVVYDMTH
jgi:hypothetical protein